MTVKNKNYVRSLVESSLCIKWVVCVVEKYITKRLKNRNEGLSGAAARTKFLNMNTCKKINKKNRGVLVNGDNREINTHRYLKKEIGG